MVVGSASAISNGMWKIILVLSLFLILGSMFAYQYFSAKTEDISQVSQAENSIIYIAGQKTGFSVSVDHVSMAKKGYVVIYDNDNGKLGKIIGNSKILPEGESRNVIISLLRMTINGESLFAVLHEDNGDNAFYPDIDTPFYDQDGNIMYILFDINQTTS